MPFTILVVEDEELTMQIMSVSLRHRGHHVLEAVSPQEGLTLARVERPDIILMDMNFKNATFDGVEAIRFTYTDQNGAPMTVAQAKARPDLIAGVNLTLVSTPPQGLVSVTSTSAVSIRRKK